MFWRKALKYWRSTLVACSILYACLLREPSLQVPPIQHADKWIHLLAFGVLSLVVLLDSKSAAIKPWQGILLAVLFPIVYGGAIEWLQEEFFYPRSGDWWVWLADSIGTGIAVSAWVVAHRWYDRRSIK